MKKILFTIVLLSFSSLATRGQGLFDQNCYYGITFDTSITPNWGYGELVITDVEPHSPADKAGIKIGDIIMEINGKATYLRDNTTIASWLFDVYDPTINFTIRNMNTYFGEYTLKRKCVNTNSINEKELASIFSFYSLEDTNQRRFTLPISVESNPNTDFADYHTFDFAEDITASGVDKLFFQAISKELETKGMTRNSSDPDLVVSIYYTYEKNPLHSKPKDDKNIGEIGIWRYDSNKKAMVKLPVFEYNDAKKDLSASQIMEAGIIFYDRKYINKERLTPIWECSIKDYATENYPFDEYLKIHVPLMLMQFPYATNKVFGAEYLIDFCNYNYTGIYFNTDDLATIHHVEEGSPAYNSGIMVGHTIKKINNKEFNHTKESLSEAYKNFITDTEEYRDKATVFKNAQGYAQCMHWDRSQYLNIAKVFKNRKYQTHFSYLYSFNRYVEEKSNEKISIEFWDGVQNRIIGITPEKRSSIVVKALQ